MRNLAFAAAIGALTVLLPAAPAGATELDVELLELETAVQARLDQLNGGRERVRLLSLRGRIRRQNDPRPAGMIGVLGKVYGGGTADADILKEARDVLDCLCAIAAEQRDVADALRQQVAQRRVRARLDRGVGLSIEQIQTAKDIIDDEPRRAARLLTAALRRLARLGGLADRALGNFGARPPPGNVQVFATFGSLALVNNTGRRFVVRDVLLSGSYSTGGGVGVSMRRALPRVFTNGESNLGEGHFFDLAQLARVGLPPTAPGGTTMDGKFVVKTDRLGAFAVDVTGLRVN